MESSVIRHMAGLPNMVGGKFLASPRYCNGGNFRRVASSQDAGDAPVLELIRHRTDCRRCYGGA